MDGATALVIMAKQPRVGYTKTRLCPPFSPQQAAHLYEALLLDTIALAGSLPGVRLAVALTPAAAGEYFQGITPPGTLLLPVQGADIGACLVQALEELFAAGFRQVIALNADGPSLPLDYLCLALAFLETSDLVLGPGEDGGYYLVGLKRTCPGLFAGIAWSTPRVLQQTLARASDLGLRAALTPPWYDVDTAQEVKRLASELAHLPPQRLVHVRRFFAEVPPTEWI